MAIGDLTPEQQRTEAEIAAIIAAVGIEPLVFELDGTATVREIVHDRGRIVRHKMLDTTGVQVYPIVRVIDENTLEVAAAGPLLGTLYVF